MKPAQKLKIGASIVASKLMGRPKPLFVQYSLLNACNATCTYCHSPERDDPQISTSDHLKIIDGLAALGTKRIKFLGGEPLMRSDIEQLIDRVRFHNVRAAMVTNAFLIPKKLSAVKKLDELIISIDGSEEVHDRQRGKGTWRLVMKAIEVCSRENLDFFLSAVVTKKSLTEIDWLLDLARDLGVMVNFQIPQFNAEVYGAEAKDWLPDPGEIRSLLDKIIVAKKEGAPVLFTARSYLHTRDWSDFSIERIDLRKGPSPCAAGKYFINIEPNGDVFPCVLHIGTFKPKNALRDGVEEAWQHAGNHTCLDCYNTWLNENKAIFDLRPTVLMNFWNNYLTSRAMRKSRQAETVP